MAQKSVTIAVNTLPFVSRIVLGADLRLREASGNIRQLFTAGTRRNAFSYSQGQAQVTALEGAQATERDTQLIEGTKTPGGAAFDIRGISLTPDGQPYVVGANSADGLDNQEVLGASAPAGLAANPLPQPSPNDLAALQQFMVNLLLRNFRLDLKVDGAQRTISLGAAILYNSVGGLNGPLATSVGTPFAQNYYPIPEGIMWQPAGNSDSNFVIAATCANNVNAPQYVSADGLDPDTGAAYTLPQDPSPLGYWWRQGWILNFHGKLVQPVSAVS